MLNHDKNNLKCYPQQFESFCFVLQSYTYKHAMVLYNGKRTRARNLNRYVHKNPPEADQVSAPGPSRTATGICIGTVGNPPELYRVSQLTWTDTNAIMLDDMLLLAVYDLVFVIMTSCPHCHTIIHIPVIQIQSYAYNHNHAMMLHTGMRRIPIKNCTNT